MLRVAGKSVLFQTNFAVSYTEAAEFDVQVDKVTSLNFRVKFMELRDSEIPSVDWVHVDRVIEINLRGWTQGFSVNSTLPTALAEGNGKRLYFDVVSHNITSSRAHVFFYILTDG